MAFILAPLGIFLGVIFFLGYENRKKTLLLLDKLEDENLQYRRINLLIDTSTKYSVGGGFPFSADLYFNEELILVCPRLNSWWGIFELRLPVMFSNDPADTYQRFHFSKVKKPKEIKITSFNALLIKYSGQIVGKTNYRFTIRFKKEEVHETVEQLKTNRLLQEY